MGKTEWQRLVEVTATCREAITDARGVVQDLDRARAEFRTWIRGELKEITRQLDVLAQASTGAIEQNVFRINARFDDLAALLLGVNDLGLTVEDLLRMLGDPHFSAQVSATFGRLIRDHGEHAGASTENVADPGGGPGP